MGFFKKLAGLLAGGGGQDDRNTHHEYVRCARCGEKIRVRVDLGSELTPEYESSEGAYHARKGVLGSGETRCFQMIEVDLYFDAEKRLVSRYISGGEFITRDAFYAEATTETDKTD